MKKTIIFLLAAAVIAAGQGPSSSADLILHNGVIWTVDEKNPSVQAVAIKDGKFVVVGSNESALKLRGPNTRVVDLKGAFVVPGFNDNHVHFASAAQFLEFNIIEEAIRAYTLNTAYANFEEKTKGSIEVGKLADLTVLSKNLLKVAPKEFLTTEVLYTIVDGKTVYAKR